MNERLRRVDRTVNRRCNVTIRVAVIALLAACASEPVPPIMSWPEYARREWSWPRVIKVDSPIGQLLYYGARHSKDPQDPQHREIERLWTEFKPDIAFNEGGYPPFEKSRDESISKHGEAGLLRFLAAGNDVPITSIDPTRAAEVAHLRRRFSTSDVKAFMVLGRIAKFSTGQTAKATANEAARLLAIFNAEPGLRNAPATVPELEVYVHARCGSDADLKSVRSEWFDPARNDGVFNEMSRASNDFRDAYMVELLTLHVNRGHRVFAVVGGSHVAMQERTLRVRIARGLH